MRRERGRERLGAEGISILTNARPGATTGRLDKIDLKILKALQNDGRIQNNALAAHVGLTPPPCLRRVRGLVQSGIIQKFGAHLDERRIGYQVIGLASIQLERQAIEATRDFETALARAEHVIQAWRLSGEPDYLLKFVALTIEHMQQQLEEFTKLPNVRNVRSFIVLGNVKDVPVPLPSPLLR